jgi:hypothetical protein
MAARIAPVPAVPIINGITHTVFLDDAGNIDASCALFANSPEGNLLGLRSNDPISQVRSLNGRTTGTKVDLTRYSFFDYQMRRKSESLQYRKNQSDTSIKKQYSQISKTKSGSYYYSNKDLIQKLNKECPNLDDLDVVIRPPTNSGVRDYKYPGYYFDRKVPYLPSL